MSDPSPTTPDWIAAWINEQRERVEKSTLGVDSLSAWFQKAAPEAAAGEAAGGSEVPGAFASLAGASVPPLGWLREHLELWQELIKAHGAYAEALAEFDRVLKRIQIDALQHLQRQLQTERRIDNPRQLYDLWIECGEEVFARAAPNEFAAAQARLANAQVALRSRQQKIVETFCRQLDLPTRSEVNTLNRQIRELRAAVEGLQGRAPTRSRRKSVRTKSA